jgi:hypothetical protein
MGFTLPHVFELFIRDQLHKRIGYGPEEACRAAST